MKEILDWISVLGVATLTGERILSHSEILEPCRNILLLSPVYSVYLPDDSLSKERSQPALRLIVSHCVSREKCWKQVVPSFLYYDIIMGLSVTTARSLLLRSWQFLSVHRFLFPRRGSPYLDELEIVLDVEMIEQRPLHMSGHQMLLLHVHGRRT